MNDSPRLPPSVTDLPTLALAELEAMLEAPEWHRGGRLPPEADLALKIGVSRPILRKALAALRETGRIVSRRGSANFVQPRANAVAASGDLNSLSIQTVFDMKRCLRFRSVVECAAAEDAARACDPKSIEALAAAHRHMISPPPGQSLFEADFGFHMAVAEAARNPYYPFALATIRDQLKLVFEFTREMQSRPMTEISENVVAEHGEILEAIRSGSVGRARDAMDLHMRRGALRLLEERHRD